MPLISNHKHEIEEKSPKRFQSSSKVVGLGTEDLCEFPTLKAPLQWLSSMKVMETYMSKPKDQMWLSQAAVETKQWQWRHMTVIAAQI